MKMRFSLFNAALALSLLLTACGGGDDVVTSGGGTSVLPCTTGAGSFTDLSGDVPFGFIDMINPNVTVTNHDITVDIGLAQIPPQLT